MSPKVRDFLAAQAVAFTAHNHSPIISFEDAKAVLPFNPSAMVKGLAFRLPDGQYAIVGMRASDRADYKKIADAFGVRRADLKAADAEAIVGDLDMAPGGVTPLPINGALVVFDLGVLDLGVVFCGTGRTDATLEIAGADLVRIAGGQVANLAKIVT
jgi:Cys-tRNA(Pro)/Cys-tRNA(Cys) deacylase